jgi:hypothetical protein
MAEFPVDPMLAKMIISSEALGVSGEQHQQGGSAGQQRWRGQGRGSGGREAAWERPRKGKRAPRGRRGEALPHPEHGDDRRARLPAHPVTLTCPERAARSKRARASLRAPSSCAPPPPPLPLQRRWPRLRAWCLWAAQSSTDPRTRQCTPTTRTEPSTGAASVSSWGAWVPRR